MKKKNVEVAVPEPKNVAVIPTLESIKNVTVNFKNIDITHFNIRF